MSASTGTVAALLRQLWRIAGPHRRRVAWGLVFTTVRSMCLGASFGVVIWVLSDIARHGSLSPTTARVAVVVVAASLVGQLFFGYLAVSLLWISSFAMVGDIRLAMLDHLRTLPMGFHRTRTQGDTVAAFTSDMQFMESFISDGLPKFFEAVGLPLVALIVLATVDPPLALATAVSIAASIPVFVWANRRFGTLGLQRQDQQAGATSRVLEYIQGIAVIKAFHHNAPDQTHRPGTLRTAIDDFRDVSLRMVARLAPLFTVFGLVLQLGVPLVITAGTYWLFSGRIDPATLLIFFVLLLNVYNPLLRLIGAMEMTRMAVASATRVTRITDAATQSEPDHGRQPADASIELANVTFGYPPDSPVLHDVSLRVPPRSMTAIVGPSGAGKSTLLHLVARFWDADSGEVRIGGVPVTDMSTETLYAQVSVVFQDVYLFAGTIFDNIAFGQPTATTAEVEAAARQAQAHEFITALPDGYNTQVGEGGTTLSGGERQRISIARAILKNAPIVLLDEATAAIDPTNEKLIQQALAELVADKTLLVVAHRLGTIRNADQIAVLDAGRIVEHGTHDDLLTRNGHYTQLWIDRQRAHGWRLATVDQ
jgi:ATP-binding cassette, subfamily B, bacterial IrtB/YbtQ